EFLTEYFDDMTTMATNIFLKGYQWPFDAQRVTDHQSSLIDMAVHQETVVRGRRVWMDFLSNPIGAEGWDDFQIDQLGAEALEYLQKTGAMQDLPIDRLAHMNQPAIDIYAENNIDLRAEPLEIALCAQHMNGGFAVDKWWRSGIARTFVIGEMAGTHGVKRPGGSALNAGQVGAMRAADHIANAGSSRTPDAEQPAVRRGLAAAGSRLKRMLANGAADVTPAEAMVEIRDRMMRYGAHLRSRPGASGALKAAKEQYARLLHKGLKVSAPRQLAAAVQALQQCLTHVGVLKAICAMFDRGAGSRGSHCILDDSGLEMHPALINPATGRPYQFKEENQSLRNEILQLTYNPAAPDLFDVDIVEPRAVPDRDIAFEVAWAEFREGMIYEL
ncbi:MAG: oxidoreductase, partial [Phycisphaerae bacterium]|nr:oxidoreductase [Phycisphaerae bacterium]